MTEAASRWARVQEIFSTAIELPPAERGAFLDRACAGDRELRQEVATLLAAHDVTGPVDRLAADILAPAIDQVHARVAIDPGRIVSHYVVLDVLGAGGMGIVCRARDERLHRVIALKFLPPHLASDPPAKRRFMQEARAAAALEHPNICTIYEIGETDDGQPFIAMPLYDGETLQARIARGPLPIDQSVAIAREIGAGLAAAHQSGIVHRDIKPSNIMLLPDGRLKVLDFGVAKVSNVTLTASGTPIGTVAYMSPEQTRGEKIDHRTDVWSLGVVLYEMVTGRRPFAADTSTGLMYAIGNKLQRPPSELRDNVPQDLDDFVATTLAKTPERRFPSMTDAIASLATLSTGGRRRSQGSQAVTASSARHGADESSSPPSAERRRATVLVTQLSDYAALLERLDPANVEEVMAGVRAAAVDAVRRHGGLVNQALGEEIVALFGIPATHEDDDLRAVRAAIELHASVRALMTPALQGTGRTVSLQTGIDSGTLVAHRLREGPRRYGVSGTPVQVAGRLASLAPADAILVSTECERVVRRHVATEATRPIQLQPDAPPMVPHRVLGESGVHARLEASDRSSLAPFTGRATELVALESLLAEARSGNGRIVLVVGDAGMGKSRMLHELRERVSATNVRVLLGRCRSYGGISPYLPIVEVLRDVLDAADKDDTLIATRILDLDPSLEPFIPLYLHMLSVQSDAFAVPRHLQGEHLHGAMLDAVVALVMATARQAPLLLMLEDWHWADDASREVLQRIAEIVDSLPMAIVVATRPEPSVLADLGSKGAIVQLGPLEAASTGAILKALLGGDRVSDDLATRLHDRTGGNPFFLEQVAHTLKEEGAIAVEAGEARLTRHIESLRLPDTVQAVIRARLDRLDGDSREVLRVASVVGREFGQRLLTAAVPPEIDTPRALERLRTAALIQQVRVVPEPAYRFKHMLTQEVAYGSLLEHQRKTVHGAIGRALEQEPASRLDENAEQLAHHFWQAESWEAALKYGRRAADRLSALSQFAQALEMLERLQAWAAHMPDDEARADLIADILLEQERLCETLGQRTRQQQIIAELISALAPRGASARLAAAYLRQGDVLTLLKRFDAADRALSTVVRLSRESGNRDTERHALRSVGLLRWHQGRHREALEVAEQTLALGRALGDDHGIVSDLANIGNILRSLGEYDRARTVLESAIALPAAHGDPPRMSSALHNLANVHRSSGNTMLALECMQRADDAMRVSMMPIQRSFHLTALANIKRQLGDVEGAMETYEQAVDLSRRARHAEGLAQGLRLLGDFQLTVRHDDAAIATLSEAATIFGQLEDRATEAETLSQVAAAYERLGDWTRAREAWEHILRLRRASNDRPAELDALEGLARAARRAASPEAAIQAYETALALAADVGSASRRAALHNTLGILQWERGRYFDALSHYESGLRLCREAGDRAHEGLMLNSMGVTLARLQRREEARTVLEESVALNRATGERLLEAHALSALAELSVQLGRIATAVECVEASLAIRRELGDNQGVEAMVRQLAELRTPRASNPSAQRG